MGAALCSMVAALSHEKKDMIPDRPLMEDIGSEAQNLKDHLAVLVARDTRAFNKIIEARIVDGSPKANTVLEFIFFAFLKGSSIHL